MERFYEYWPSQFLIQLWTVLEEILGFLRLLSFFLSHIFHSTAFSDFLSYISSTPIMVYSLISQHPNLSQNFMTKSEPR